MAGVAGGLEAGVGGGLLVGVLAVPVLGLTAVRPDLTTTVGPAVLLTQDRRSFLTLVLALVLAFGLAFGLTAGLVVGLTIGLTVALAIGRAETAWTGLATARLYLAARRRVPWRLMAFLHDAHERRGVLRQVGGVYQFRHLDLQRHLAQQPRAPIGPLGAE
jgi:hypothetical protein